MNPIVGTWALTRLALRLDRVRLPLWVAAITMVIVATAVGFAQLYPDAASRRLLAAGLGTNPALLAFYGPLDAPESIGGLTVWRQGQFQLLLVAVMSLLTVVRHSRAEEEAGRIELVGAAAIDRQAPLLAAVMTALLASTGVGAAVAGTMVAVGEQGAGSIAFGAALAATGWAFAGLAAVAAQVTDHARTARGLAGFVLGVAFALRAAGDASGQTLDWLSWLSPLGWAQRVRPYADEQWWTLALLLGVFALGFVAASWLRAHRDLGSGLLQSRPGASRAPRYLGHPLGLGWRLQRASVITWLVVMLLVGALFGVVVDAITQLFEDTPQLAEILARIGGSGGVIDAFLGAIMGVLALLVSVYAITAALQLRQEEERLHAEHVLATAVTRWSWAAGHLIFSLGVPALLLLAGGAAAGLASGLVTGAGLRDVGRIAASALVQLPAVWVLAGIAVLIVGRLPRLTAAAYGLLAAFVLLGQVGEALQLPQAVLNVSPFVHVPALPAAELTWPPLLWLTLVAVVLLAAGLVGLRRRDVMP